jgi:hypothetical protein
MPPAPKATSNPPDARAFGAIQEDGFSDRQLSVFFGVHEDDVKEPGGTRAEDDLQARRHMRGGIRAYTPYYYSTYESEDESGLIRKRRS